MTKSECTSVKPNGSSEEPFGTLALSHVGIIFIILALSHVLSTLLRFSLGNSVGVFLLTRHTCCLIIFK